jgi:hypothetical protein
MKGWCCGSKNGPCGTGVRSKRRSAPFLNAQRREAVRGLLDQWRTRLEGRRFSDSSDLIAEDRER